MSIRRTLSLIAPVAMGLAGMSAPAPALAQDQGVLPADPQDFQCFVLLQQRREAYLANTTLDQAQRAEIVNNLTIISAYYAGRISHYSSSDAVVQFQSATAQVEAATDEQKDAFANTCANFYLSVMNVLVTTGEEAAAASE